MRSSVLNGIITDWNFGAERIFGYSADKTVGASIMRLIPADRQEEELEMLSRIRRGERVDHFEAIRLAKGERPLNCAITVSPIRGFRRPRDRLVQGDSRHD